MPEFFTVKKGNRTKQVPSDELADFEAAGWAPVGKKRIKTEFGERTVSGSEAVKRIRSGEATGLVSSEEIAKRRGQEALEEAFGNDNVQTFGEAALNTLTFGAAAPALRELSEFTEGDSGATATRREVNPGAALAGDVTGTVIGVLGGRFTPGGLLGKAATRAGKAAGGGVRGGVTTGLIDGAVFSGAQTLADASISDEPINAEKIIASMASGALYGGAIGGAFAKAGQVISKATATKAAASSFKISDDVVRATGTSKKALQSDPSTFANTTLRSHSVPDAAGVVKSNLPIIDGSIVGKLAHENPNIAILKTGFFDDLGQHTKAALDVQKLTGLPLEAVTKQNEVLARVWAANAVSKQAAKTATVGKPGSLVDTLTKHTPATVRTAAAAVGNVKARITGAIGSFVKAAGKPRRGIVPAASSVLSKVSFSEGDVRPKSAGSRRKDFLRVRDEIQNLAQNPGQARARVGKALATVGVVKPALSASIHQKALQRLEYLNRILPGPRGAAGFGPERWAPTDTEIDKFARIVAAAEDPLSILDDMNSGKLTQEAVDTVKALYPEIYNEMRMNIVEDIDNIRENVEYTGRLQLGILFQVPTDKVLEPAFVQSMQTNYALRAQEREQPQPSEAGSKVIQSTQTATQRIGN